MEHHDLYTLQECKKALWQMIQNDILQKIRYIQEHLDIGEIHFRLFNHKIIYNK